MNSLSEGAPEVIQAKHRNRLPLPQPAVVHVRRSYTESRFGQIHLWTAYPSGGGFDERVPVAPVAVLARGTPH